MATAIEEKWKELSTEQQKWRNKKFEHYDDLYEIYDGKIAEGKRCKRTTDNNYSTLSFQETENFHEVADDGLTTPRPNISAPGLTEDDIWFKDGVDANGIGYNAENTEAEYKHDMSSNLEGSSAKVLPELGRQNFVVLDEPKKGNVGRQNYVLLDELEKGKPKKGKNDLLENLVAMRKEELESYNDLKTKQIESYKEVKLAQIEKNDPKNDPYSMENCITKLKGLGVLSPGDMVKAVNYLMKGQLYREAFIELDEFAFATEFLKEALKGEPGTTSQ